MNTQLCAIVTIMMTVMLLRLALFPPDRPLESLQYPKQLASIDIDDEIFDERQSEDSFECADATMSESALFNDSLPPFEPGTLTWESTASSTRYDSPVRQDTLLIEPFILELEALAASEPVPSSDTRKLHRLVDFYPLPPPLEYSFDRIITDENRVSDKTDETADLSTDLGREELSDSSHSHLSTAETEHVLDGLDNAPTLNSEAADSASRFGAYGLLANWDDDSEGSVYSDYEERDIPSDVEDDTGELHRPVDFYPLPPPLEYSFDRIITDENRVSDKTDETADLSTDLGREELSDSSHSHLSTAETEHVLDGLDNAPTLNSGAADSASRFGAYGLLANWDDDSEGSVYSDYEERDIPSDVEDGSGELHRLVDFYPLPPPLEYSFDRIITDANRVSDETDETADLSTDLGREELSDTSHSHLSTSETEHVLDGLDNAPTPHSEATETASRFEVYNMLANLDDDSEGSVYSDYEERDIPSDVEDDSEGSVYSDYEPEESVHSNHEEPLEFDIPLLDSQGRAINPARRETFEMVLPALVSRGQENSPEAAEEFAAETSSNNQDLNLDDDDSDDEDATVIYHTFEPDDCQITQRRQCETIESPVTPPSMSIDSLFAGREKKIRFNVPEPLLDYHLIKSLIPDYVLLDCDARIQKLCDTLAPLPDQCKPVDGTHKASKSFVYQSQEWVDNYTEYMEQCVTQLRAVKKEMEKVTALESAYLPEHRKIGKQIIQSIDKGIEDIVKHDITSHKDIISDVKIICQKRHMPTRLLARALTGSWRDVANDVAFNVSNFYEEREANAMLLLSKVSKLMRDCEVYAHNIVVEQILHHRRVSERL